jgi:hypothetical protein
VRDGPQIHGHLGTAAALAACAGGFLLALTGLLGLIAGAVLIRAGVAAATLVACAALAAPRNHASPSDPRPAPHERRPAAPPYPYSRGDWSR